MTLRTLIAVLTAATLLTGCATRKETPEGIDLQARNPKLKLQRTTPEARPEAFDKVMLEPVKLDFRQVPPLTGTVSSYQDRSEFPVSAADQQALAALFDEVLRDELGDNRYFRLSSATGDGVLVVRPSIRDIVSHLPPEEPPGRSKVFLDSIGEGTLVIEFADGASGEVFASASDRRKARPAGMWNNFGGVRANTVMAAHELRLLARRWARSLEMRLQQLYFEAKPR